jgi:hypothetical protein
LLRDRWLPQTTLWVAPDPSGNFLTPSPPGEQATARQHQARGSSTGDRSWHGSYGSRGVYQDRRGWLTVVTKEIAIPFRFGRVIAEGDFITEIEEKPNYLQEVLAGIYVMQPEILGLIPGSTYFGVDSLIKSMIAKHYPVCKYLMHDYWIDIGQLSDYELAKQDFAARSLQAKTSV